MAESRWRMAEGSWPVVYHVPHHLPSAISYNLGGFRLIFRAYGLALTQDAKPNGDYVILVN